MHSRCLATNAQADTLRQDVVDDVSVDVGQASFQTVVVERQPLVVEAH